MVRSASFPADPPHGALRFAVGVDSASYAHTRRAFRSVLVGSVSAGVALFAALGYLITHLGLVPLRRLSHEAQALSPSALSQRLVVARLPGELCDLAQSFNGALDRLEAAYAQLESFNADVAHELRTPLTNLIGETQVALSRERSMAHLVDVLQSNLEDLERLRSIVNDMLFLARANQGERPQHLRRASLAGEVERAVDFLDFLLEEAGVTVRVQGDAEAPIERAASCARRTSIGKCSPRSRRCHTGRSRGSDPSTHSPSRSGRSRPRKTTRTIPTRPKPDRDPAPAPAPRPSVALPLLPRMASFGLCRPSRTLPVRAGGLFLSNQACRRAGLLGGKARESLDTAAAAL